MKEYVIKIVPPIWDDRNFEDLLATDALFIEYFNAFLSLPSFPEPLQFNRENGGFEIVSDAKRLLARDIKAAVRSSRRPKKIYRVVHNHSFSAIPLIPIEDPRPEDDKEIDTTFTVKSLNREQGVSWLKSERLPAFLTSDLYLEYRLSVLVSQATVAAQRPHALSTIRLDYTPPPPGVGGAQRGEEGREEGEEEEEDEAEVANALMRQMFVSMGNATTTDTESWVSQAQTALTSLTMTTTTNRRPTSSISQSAHTSRSASAKSRPISSVGKDSGFCSPSKSSMSEEMDTERLKPHTPRPSEPMCVTAAEEERGDVVYTMPRMPTPEAVLEEDESRTSSRSELSYEEVTKSAVKFETSRDSSPVMFQSVDELGALVVGTAVKYALVDVCGVSVQQVEDHTAITDILPDQKHRSMSKEELEDITLKSPPTARRQRKMGRQELTQVMIETPEPEDDKPTLVLGKEEKESDEDSLLNSDDDYDEDGRDTFFHQRRHQIYGLGDRKGLGRFKAFLRGTVGEKYWNLWLDIERAKMVTDPTEQANYLLALRERYDKLGGVYELSPEVKGQLGLERPSQWTLVRLGEVQVKVAEPLVLYWGPQFLLSQKPIPPPAPPTQHYLYQHQRLISQPLGGPAVYPDPPVAPLLPLRPRACVPVTTPRQQPEIQDLFAELNAEPAPEVPKTTPLVGNKRVYDIPDKFVAFTSMKVEKKNLKNDKLSNKLHGKTPKELITPRLLPETKPRSRPLSHTGTRSRPNSRPNSGSLAGSKPRSRPSSATVEASSSTILPKDRVAWGSTSSLTTPHPAVTMTTRSRSNSVLSNESDMSDFTGGRRMEGLLQALDSEKRAGSFFRRHVEKAGNKLWRNCLDFWLELQEYHKIFYSEVLDPFVLNKKAKYIFSTYIVAGAPCSVECSDTARSTIYQKLEPPFEELFDPAEEYVLSVLYDAWVQSLNEDIASFEKVELTESKRHLDTKSRYVKSLQKRGIIKERPRTPEEDLSNYQDPVYDAAVWDSVPAEFQDFSLDRLVHSRLELEQFRAFLAENFASMDLTCWMDIEAFKRLPHGDEKRRDLKAKDIKVKYLTNKYFFGPNSPAGREGQEKVMSACGGWGKLLADRPPTQCLLDVQTYAQERLQNKWLPLFLATEGFAERQRPRSGMGDAVEDVMIQRKKKSQAIYKMLENKLVSSSKDILMFRKALSNPITSSNFRRFLGAKTRGDHFYENDVLFWQEVQRYKDLCHVHSDRALIHQKTLAIIHCFLDSPVPPSLQVDIAADMADKIADRKLEATPYLFREAQVTVFRILFPKWQEFCTFRSNLTEDKVAPTLERIRKKNMATEKKRLRELDEKNARLEKMRSDHARRQDLGSDTDEGRSDIDPYERLTGNSETGTEGMERRNSLAWSYSQYMKALDHEEVMNEVDDLTFSSLTLNTQGVDTVADDNSEAGDKVSIATSDARKTKKEAKKSPKSDDESPTPPKPSKPSRSKHETPDNGTGTPSLTVPTPPQKNGVTRASSPKSSSKSDPQVPPPSVTTSDEASSSTTSKGGPPAEQRRDRPQSSVHTHSRMARKMPPLVGKP